jgi:hypothetical protein
LQRSVAAALDELAVRKAAAVAAEDYDAAKRIKAEKNLRAVLQDLEERMTEYDDGFWGI